MDALKPREIQVIQHLAEGKPAKQIAADIGVTKWAIDRFVASAMNKTGIRSSAGLVGFAFRKGLIQ